ncbi:MAG: hypothetical protein KDB53_12100, partial [Planctomycetes bacterium]|nr:hypothetical protein [Planctomycetota bacterium]
MTDGVRSTDQPGSVTPELTEFVSCLRQTGRALRRELRLSAAAAGLVRVLLVAVSSFAIDRWLRLSIPMRLVLMVAAVSGLVAWAVRAWLKTCRIDADPHALAAALDRRSPEGSHRNFLSQTLATLAELASRRGRASGDSEELLHLAVERARNRWRGHDWSVYRNPSRERRRRLHLAALLIIPTAALLADPGAVSLWFRRWFLASEARWPQDTWLEVEGMKNGRMIVPRGEPVDIRARASKASRVIPESVFLEWEVDDVAAGASEMQTVAPNDFRYELGGVGRSAEIRLKGGDDRLGPLVLEARSRPSLQRFVVRASLPEAGVNERFEMKFQDRDLKFRARTQIRVECEADQYLSEFGLVEAGDHITVERLTSRSFVVSWLHLERTRLRFRLRASDTGLDSRAQELVIGLDLDRVPRVQCEIEGVRERITPQASLPTTLIAQDDHGLSMVRLEWGVGAIPQEAQAADPRFVPIYPGPAAGETAPRDWSGATALEVSELGLAVGGYLFLRGAAADLCHLGAQTGWSRPRLLRVVEPALLRREITNRLQKARARFRQAATEALDIEQQLSAEGAEPGRSELARRHRLLERQVWATERVFSASARELALNRLIKDKAQQMLQDDILTPL